MQWFEDTRFLTAPHAFARWAEGRKQLRMEYFIARCAQPITCLWIKENQLGGNGITIGIIASPFRRSDTTQPLIICTRSHHTRRHGTGCKTFSPSLFGDLSSFHWAVTHQQALKILDRFVQEHLPHFGTYQDAMLQNEPSMYHAHISFYLNGGLLFPRECPESRTSSLYKTRPTERCPRFCPENYGMA